MSDATRVDDQAHAEDDDQNRLYVLRAARGEIDNDDALEIVRTARYRPDLGRRDPELAAALAEGDLRHRGDNRRWPDGPPPWAQRVDVDPATNEAFDRLRDSAGTGQGQPDSPVTWDGDSGDTGDSRPPRRTSWTAAELMATDFPDPRWAVDGFIPEGLNLFAGPPKVGKSWLSLGLSVAVASGGKALGRIDVDQGQALYLALEDTPRRLKARLGKILGHDPAPAGLTIATECPPLPTGGAERIADWLDQHPDARLVVVDVFARVRGPVVRDTSAYSADYGAAAQAKALADSYGVAVVLVHHTRKMADEDFVATVSGTQGLAGAADAIAVLKRTRGKADGLLSLTGRDVDEAEYALTFAADIGAWQLSDTPAAEVRLTDSQATVLAYLRDNDGVGPKAVADGTSLDYELVKKTMRRMADRGELDTDGKGRYFTPVPAVPAVPVPGQSGDSPVPHLSLVPDEDC